MNRTIGYVTLLAMATLCTIIAVVKPSLLNDQNSFLKNFVNHEFINVLGIILAITLASTAQIHLAFNRIEERHNTPGALKNSRANLRKSSYWLIGLFIGGAVLVVLKPVATDATTPTAEALFNSGALFILLWQALILLVLTQLVFMIEPEFPPPEDPPPRDSIRFDP